MIRIEHNATTGEIVEIELTKQEIAEKEASAALVAAEKEKALLEEANKAKQKAALLEKLGITEEEAKLLLGGN
jgi:hypothetical protein